MIKNKDIFKQVSDLMLDYSRGLDHSIVLVIDGYDADGFKIYRRAVGKVLAQIYLEVLAPLYQQHPELKLVGLN